MNLNSFLEKAKTLPKQRLAVVVAEDEFVLAAVKKAKDYGFVEPLLIGNRQAILDKLSDLQEKRTIPNY